LDAGIENTGIEKNAGMRWVCSGKIEEGKKTGNN
jgi:hypothetical protein